MTDALALLPSFLVNEEDVERLDYLFDKVAANSRWSNVDVARAMCRMMHYICGE